MGIPFAYLHQPLVGLQKLSNKECFHVFYCLKVTKPIPIKAVTEKPEQSRYKLNFYQTIAMKSNSKNVAWATFRTATQVVAIMAVILVTLIACGKSDSGGSVQNKDLIGTWKLESRTIDGKSLEDYVSDIFSPISETTKKCIYRSTLTFLEKEGMLNICYNDPPNSKEECECRSIPFIYTISGNTIALKTTEGAESGTFSIVGNKLTLSSSIEDKKGNKHTSVDTYVKQ